MYNCEGTIRNLQKRLMEKRVIDDYMEKKAKLQPTAALVMHWAEELCQQKPLNGYLDYLDLNEGEELLKICNDICNWYHEVILNRKSIIYNMVVSSLISNLEPSQIVIMAAGMCPLSLKILHEYKNKVSHIFEIDQGYMKQKRRIYREFYPERSNQVTCVSMDITRPDLINQLQYQECFDIGKPQIIIAEGISYYLSSNELEKLMNNFSSSYNGNKFIMDYLLPFYQINNERRNIPQDIFRIIQEQCGIPEITTHTRDDIKKVLRGAGGHLHESFNLNEMEFKRKGRNRYFMNPDDGWIECALGTI